MPFKLFEIHVLRFHVQFMLGTFLINCTKLEKTESTGKVFIPLGNLKNKFDFRN